MISFRFGIEIISIANLWWILPFAFCHFLIANDVLGEFNYGFSLSGFIIKFLKGTN